MNLAQALQQDTDTLENSQDATSSGQDGAKRSLRSAINAHCRSCGYDPLDKGAGNWRQQIQSCPVTSCELYDVRPISKPKKERLPVEE